MDTVQLLGAAMGLGFAAGLRLYATVLMVGLGLRFGWFQLPAAFDQHLPVLTNPVVLTLAGVAYVMEFFADKVPWLDSLWDAFHTFVRPLGTVLLSASVLGSIDPAVKLSIVILCGGVAFASHSSKAATRLAVNHSPEPFSNIGLSLAEDLFAPFGVWLSLRHPELVLALVSAFLLIFAWISPKIFRLIRLQVVALRSWLAKRPAFTAAESSFPLANVRPDAAAAISILGKNAMPIPDGYAEFLRKNLDSPVLPQDAPLGIRCAATKKVRGLRHTIGYLTVSDREILFVAKRWFAYRLHRTKIGDLQSAELRQGIFMHTLILRTSATEISFYVFVGRAFRPADPLAAGPSG